VDSRRARHQPRYCCTGRLNCSVLRCQHSRCALPRPCALALAPCPCTHPCTPPLAHRASHTPRTAGTNDGKAATDPAFHYTATYTDLVLAAAAQYGPALQVYEERTAAGAARCTARPCATHHPRHLCASARPWPFVCSTYLRPSRPGALPLFLHVAPCPLPFPPRLHSTLCTAHHRCVLRAACCVLPTVSLTTVLCAARRAPRARAGLPRVRADERELLQARPGRDRGRDGQGRQGALPGPGANTKTKTGKYLDGAGDGDVLVLVLVLVVGDGDAGACAWLL
jgi:hypothetical protein